MTKPKQSLIGSISNESPLNWIFTGRPDDMNVEELAGRLNQSLVDLLISLLGYMDPARAKAVYALAQAAPIDYSAQLYYALAGSSFDGIRASLVDDISSGLSHDHSRQALIRPTLLAALDLLSEAADVDVAAGAIVCEVEANGLRGPGEHSPDKHPLLSRIAVAANPSRRDSPTSDLVRLAEEYLVWYGQAADLLDPDRGHHIHMLRGSVTSVRRHSWIGPVFERQESGRLPFCELLPGRLGGVRQIARMVEAGEVELVIYLMDPADPSTQLPEVESLRRTCLRNQVALITTLRAARERLGAMLARLDRQNADEVPADEIPAVPVAAVETLTRYSVSANPSARTFAPNIPIWSHPESLVRPGRAAAMAVDTANQLVMVRDILTHIDIFGSFEELLTDRRTYDLLEVVFRKMSQYKMEYEIGGDVERLTISSENVWARHSHHSDERISTPQRVQLPASVALRIRCIDSDESWDLEVPALLASGEIDHVFAWESSASDRSYGRHLEVIERSCQVQARSYRAALFRGNSAISNWCKGIAAYFGTQVTDSSGAQRRQVVYSSPPDAPIVPAFIGESLESMFERTFGVSLVLSHPEPSDQPRDSAGNGRPFVAVVETAASYLAAKLKQLRALRQSSGVRLRVGVGWGEAMAEVMTAMENLEPRGFESNDLIPRQSARAGQRSTPEVHDYMSRMYPESTSIVARRHVVPSLRRVVNRESVIVLELVGTMAAREESFESRQVAARLARHLDAERIPFGLLGLEAERKRSGAPNTQHGSNIQYPSDLYVAEWHESACASLGRLDHNVNEAALADIELEVDRALRDAYHADKDSTGQFAEMIREWEDLDLAILTCGGTSKAKELRALRLFDDESLKRTIRREAVGHIAGTFLASDGREVRPDGMVQRCVSAAVLNAVASDVENGKAVILIADNTDSRPRIITAALKSGIVSVLISDRETAMEVLSETHSVADAKEARVRTSGTSGGAQGKVDVDF